MAKKTYIIDTSVILEDPYIILTLQDNDVVIPEVVLDELDSMKRLKDEKGYNSRQALNLLDKLVQEAKLRGESLDTGITTDGGGKIKVELNHTKHKMPEFWVASPNDNRILQVAKAYMTSVGKTGPVILITKDHALRVKAAALGVRCEAYKREQVCELEQQYTGRTSLFVPSEFITYLNKNGSVSKQECMDVFAVNTDELEINQFVKLTCGSSSSYMAIWTGKSMKKLGDLDSYKPCKIEPRNIAQKLMIYALSRPADEVPLVILKGPAGTAKTLLALAVGLDQVDVYGGYSNQKKPYRKILVCRTSVTMDEDIGYLPGDEMQKLAPYMRPIRDNLEVILHAMAKGDTEEEESLKKEKSLKERVNEYFTSEIITTEAVGFLRGRSITKQYVIIDEAQNATPNQIKSILTRIGEGTKLVLCGDPEQIDHPYLDERTNGLSVAAELMKGSPYCMQITLTQDECVRSKLAQEAIVRFRQM